MKTRLAAVLALALTVPAVADGPKLEDKPLDLTDPKLPLRERRLDRRVYVVSLEGAWNKPPRKGAAYQLNVKFGDDETYTHKPINEDLFKKGEMRFMVPEYVLVRTKTAKGGKLTFFVTERATSNAKDEIISDSLTLQWPLKRRVSNLAPETKYSPKRPIDAFLLPEDK